MTLIVIESEAAELDFDGIINYLSENAGDKIAYRFLEMLKSAYVLLAEMPRVGAPCDFELAELLGMRMWLVPRFPNHLIFYQESDQGLRIARILDGSRDIRRIFS